MTTTTTTACTDAEVDFQLVRAYRALADKSQATGGCAPGRRPGGSARGPARPRPRPGQSGLAADVADQVTANRAPTSDRVTTPTRGS